MTDLIKKPVISEKSFSQASSGVYVFVVARKANKQLVAAEIKKRFKVDVADVRMINTCGKVKRVGKKYGKRRDIKKAYVALKPGQKIAIFEEEKKSNKEVESHKSTPQIGTDKSKSV